MNALTYSALCALIFLLQPIPTSAQETQLSPRPGRLTGWGWVGSGMRLEDTLPKGWDAENIVAVSAGEQAWAALNSHGHVVTGGRVGWANDPTPDHVGGCVFIDAGAQFFLAVRTNGTVAIWGEPDAVALLKPRADILRGVSQVAAGRDHALALLQDGTVHFWGPNYEPTGEYGPAAETLTANLKQELVNVVSIHSSILGCTALKRDGSVVRWHYFGEENRSFGIQDPPFVDAKFPFVELNTGFYALHGIDEKGILRTAKEVRPDSPFGKIRDQLGPLSIYQHILGFSVVRQKDGKIYIWGTPSVEFDTSAERFEPLLDFELGGSFHLPHHTAFVIGTEPSYLQGFSGMPITGAELKAALDGFEKERLAADDELKAFEKRYLDELGKLKASAAANSRPQIVTLIGDEIAHFRDRSRPAIEQPDVMARLQKVYRDGAPERETARDAAVVEVYEKAAGDLQALQDRLTQEKQLQDAVEVRTEKEKVMAALELLKNPPAREANAIAVPAAITFEPIPEDRKIFSIDDPRVPGELVAIGTSGGFRFDPDASDRARIVHVTADAGSWWALKSNGEIFGYGGGQRQEISGAPKLDRLFSNHRLFGFDRRGNFWCPSEKIQPPEGPADLVAIATRNSDHEKNSLALYADGTVKGWGEYYDRDRFAIKVPPEVNAGKDIVQIAINYTTAAALKKNGDVIAWGSTSAGKAYELPDTFRGLVKLVGAFNAYLGLKADGTVVAWTPGGHDREALAVPTGLTDVVDVVETKGMGLALRADGTWVGWGDDNGTGILKQLDQLKGARWISVGRGEKERFILGIKPDPEDLRK